MTTSEAIALMWRAHVQNVVRACQCIEAQPWSASEKEIALRSMMEAGATEWLAKGWVTVKHFMHDNENSRLDIAAIDRNGSDHCEFKPQARKEHLSGYQRANGGKAT